MDTCMVGNHNNTAVGAACTVAFAFEKVAAAGTVGTNHSKLQDPAEIVVACLGNKVVEVVVAWMIRSILLVES